MTMRRMRQPDLDREQRHRLVGIPIWSVRLHPGRDVRHVRDPVEKPLKKRFVTTVAKIVQPWDSETIATVSSRM